MTTASPKSWNDWSEPRAMATSRCGSSRRQYLHSLSWSKGCTNEFGKNNEEQTYLLSTTQLPGGSRSAAGRGTCTTVLFSDGTSGGSRLP